MKVRKRRERHLKFPSNIFKAYLGANGEVRLYRPDLNMRRLERSARRLALPVSRHISLA